MEWSTSVVQAFFSNTGFIPYISYDSNSGLMKVSVRREVDDEYVGEMIFSQRDSAGRVHDDIVEFIKDHSYEKTRTHDDSGDDSDPDCEVDSPHYPCHSCANERVCKYVEQVREICDRAKGLEGILAISCLYEH